MFASDNLCSVVIEDVFGPLVSRACLDGFDFTLLFEETILTILPLAIARKEVALQFLTTRIFY